PITVVGGCHNGEFDISMWNIITGMREDGLRYFRLRPKAGRFWYRDWIPNCWAWWLTSKARGGAIDTIANTGLGTHGNGDSDNNSIADYLEVLDGWLELRFLQLYGEEHYDILGENHGETLTGYLHRFLGNGAKMDVKMVQQWELFGDPSLKIGGYE
ncbi:MAG: peptidase C25, partial [Petrotogales bacterium]